jgi:hypothetical protein
MGMGDLKKSKKRKKSYKMTKKRGKKEKKGEKLKKKMQKDVLYCVADSNPFKDVKIGKVERAALGASEWLTC